jgi:hypothetical protein
MVVLKIKKKSQYFTKKRTHRHNKSRIGGTIKNTCKLKTCPKFTFTHNFDSDANIHYNQSYTIQKNVSIMSITKYGLIHPISKNILIEFQDIDSFVSAFIEYSKSVQLHKPFIFISALYQLLEDFNEITTNGNDYTNFHHFNELLIALMNNFIQNYNTYKNNYPHSLKKLFYDFEKILPIENNNEKISQMTIYITKIIYRVLKSIGEYKADGSDVVDYDYNFNKIFSVENYLPWYKIASLIKNTIVSGWCVENPKGDSYSCGKKTLLINKNDFYNMCYDLSIYEKLSVAFDGALFLVFNLNTTLNDCIDIKNDMIRLTGQNDKIYEMCVELLNKTIICFTEAIRIIVVEFQQQIIDNLPLFVSNDIKTSNDIREHIKRMGFTESFQASIICTETNIDTIFAIITKRDTYNLLKNRSDNLDKINKFRNIHYNEDLNKIIEDIITYFTPADDVKLDKST